MYGYANNNGFYPKGFKALLKPMLDETDNHQPDLRNEQLRNREIVFNTNEISEIDDNNNVNGDGGGDYVQEIDNLTMHTSNGFGNTVESSGLAILFLCIFLVYVAFFAK